MYMWNEEIKKKKEKEQNEKKWGKNYLKSQIKPPRARSAGWCRAEQSELCLGTVRGKQSSCTVFYPFETSDRKQPWRGARNCPSNAGRLSAFSALSILQEKPRTPLVPSLQRAHTAAASAAPDFPVSASPGLPRADGHSFCSASPPPRVGFQLSQQSSSAPGQSSPWCTLRTFKAVQQKGHRNPFAPHSSNIVLITPGQCPQTGKHITAHIRRDVKLRTAKWVYKHPKSQYKACWSLILHKHKPCCMQTHICRYPYMQITYTNPFSFPIFFFFFFFVLTFWYACCGKCVSLWLWWQANVYVGDKKKKNGEGARHVFREPESCTQRLLFIAPSWWNREKNPGSFYLQLLTEAWWERWQHLGSLCSCNWQPKVMS